MNYIENETFINNELIPLIDNEITSYIEEEIRFAESSNDIEDMLDINCPEDLKNDILSAANDLISECIDEYEIAISDRNEYEDHIMQLIDSEFEKCKNDIVTIELESVERDDFFDEYEYDY